MKSSRQTTKKGMNDLAVRESTNTTNFDDYYFDDNNVPPNMRAKIELEVDQIGKIVQSEEGA